MTERVWYVQLPGDGGSFVIHELEVVRRAAAVIYFQRVVPRSGEDVERESRRLFESRVSRTRDQALDRGIEIMRDRRARSEAFIAAADEAIDRMWAERSGE